MSDPFGGTFWARYWAKVDVRGEDECWPWTGATRGGYGQIRPHGNRLAAPIQAHRAAVMADGRPLPVETRHTCDNPPCQNPRHLLDGTRQLNVADMVTRGRQSSKLTTEQVHEVRRRRTDGETIRALATEFGVHRRTISRAVTGSTWSHLPTHGGSG